MTHFIFSQSKQKHLYNCNFIACHLIFHPFLASDVVLYKLFCSVATHSTRPRKTTKLCVGKAVTWRDQQWPGGIQVVVSWKDPLTRSHRTKVTFMIFMFFVSLFFLSFEMVSPASCQWFLGLKFKHIGIHLDGFPNKLPIKHVAHSSSMLQSPWELWWGNTFSPRIPQSDLTMFWTSICGTKTQGI